MQEVVKIQTFGAVPNLCFRRVLLDTSAVGVVSDELNNFQAYTPISTIISFILVILMLSMFWLALLTALWLLPSIIFHACHKVFKSSWTLLQNSLPLSDSRIGGTPESKQISGSRVANFLLVSKGLNTKNFVRWSWWITINFNLLSTME